MPDHKLTIDGGIIGVGLPLSLVREVARRVVRNNAEAAGVDPADATTVPVAYAPVLTDFSPGNFGRLAYPVGRIARILAPGVALAHIQARPAAGEKVLAVLTGLDTRALTPGCQVPLPGIWWAHSRTPCPPGCTRLVRLDLPDPPPATVAGDSSPTPRTEGF